MSNTPKTGTPQDWIDDYESERAQRSCGAYVAYFDEHAGRTKYYRQFCGDFRNCPMCLTRRAKEMRGRGINAFARAQAAGNPAPRWRVVPEAEAAAFGLKLKRHGKEKYRAPVTGKGVFFLHDADDNITSHELTVHDLSSTSGSLGGLNWERIALTPERKRTSGELGRPEKEERDPNAVLAELVAVCIPEIMTREQVAECAVKAEQDTAHLAPETVEDVIAAVRERALCLQAHLIERTVELYVVTGNDHPSAELDAERDVPLTSIKRYITPSKIDWEPTHKSCVNDTIDVNEAPVRTVPVPGMDFMPAPVELMQNLA